MEIITRKFLVKNIPGLPNFQKSTYRRFYLYSSENVVIRVQDIDGKYELERKADKSVLVREEQKMEITKDEFEKLIKMAEKKTERDSYLISKDPQITLRIYHGDYEGLVRAEVVFASIKESENFEPLAWFDREITNSPLAKEGALLKLSENEFKQLLI